MGVSLLVFHPCFGGFQGTPTGQPRCVCPKKRFLSYGVSARDALGVMFWSSFGPEDSRKRFGCDDSVDLFVQNMKGALEF